MVDMAKIIAVTNGPYPEYLNVVMRLQPGETFTLQDVRKAGSAITYTDEKDGKTYNRARLMMICNVEHIAEAMADGLVDVRAEGVSGETRDNQYSPKQEALDHWAAYPDVDPTVILELWRKAHPPKDDD